MLVACWSPKGGSGTTVVAAVVVLALARSSSGGALVVDLAGGLPAVLGAPDPVGPGLSDWLEAPAGVAAEALRRLEVEIGRGLALLPRGAGAVTGAAGLRAESLVSVLATDGRPVVADCGRADRSPGRDLALGATLSLCVLRPCYLALRRALAADLRPTGVVVVTEPGRALKGRDVEDVLGCPSWPRCRSTSTSLGPSTPGSWQDAPARCRAVAHPRARRGGVIGATDSSATARVHARLLADGAGEHVPLPDRVEALVGEEAPLLGPRQRARVVDQVFGCGRRARPARASAGRSSGDRRDGQRTGPGQGLGGAGRRP